MKKSTLSKITASVAVAKGMAQRALSGKDPADVKDPFGRRGKFYRLLELGRPSRFPQHGRLSPKHVQTLLKLRAQSMSLEDIGQLHQEIARGAKTRLTRMKS